jgi:hypothetical protein
VSTEILRPTDATETTWATISAIWDNNTSTSASITNSNEAPSLSVGGGNLDEAVDSWGSPAETWSAADLKVVFEWGPGAASDSIHVEYGTYSGGTFTAIADLVALTTSTVAKDTFTAVLSTGDFGAAYVNIALLRVRVNGDKDAGPDGAVAHMYEVWVEGEYTGSSDVIFASQVDEISQQMRTQTAAKLGGVLIE